MDPLFTLDEVSAYLKVHAATIVREIKDGKITATKVRGQWRFRQDDIDSYLESRTIKAKRKKLIA